jgi:YVTN family beta-propeller protein
VARPAVIAGLAALLAANLPALAAPPRSAAITERNWGSVTAPVYGTSEKGVYKGAELFAGPKKFGGLYYHGVLPNGRIVRPAGTSIQVGMNPLGLALTPDGRYLVTSNDDERNGNLQRPSSLSLQSAINRGGYSLTVIDTRTMKVVSQIASGPVFVGLKITGRGPYTVWASGGPSNSIKVFTIARDGEISSAGADIPIAPTLPANKGFVSNYTPTEAFNAPDAGGNKPAVPIGFNRTAGAHTTYPAGSALSPNGRFLYVACNGDNSVAVINTATRAVVRRVPAGYFPYDVAVSADGTRVLVSNWGVTEYRFARPEYDDEGRLSAIRRLPNNLPEGFYVPRTNTAGSHPKTSSVSILSAPGGDGARLAPMRAVYHGKPLDALYQVGDTHPSALCIVSRPAEKGKVRQDVAYVAKANSDSLGVIALGTSRKLPTWTSRR